MARWRVTLRVAAALGLAACTARGPVEPLESITLDDVRLAPQRARPGAIVDIPLDREPDEYRLETPDEDEPIVTGWSFEPGMDRPRGSYRVIGGPDLSVRSCRQSCSSETMCVAYTFQSGGGGATLCTLKHLVTDPRPCGRCSSGVKPGARTD